MGERRCSKTRRPRVDSTHSAIAIASHSRCASHSPVADRLELTSLAPASLPRQWEIPSLPLPLALDYFTRRGAEIVRVHWRVFGANGIESNPSCAVLASFVRPAMHHCPQHFVFKTLFRARRGLKAFDFEGKLPHQQVADSLHTFASNGSNISACVLGPTSRNFNSPCSVHGYQPPNHGRELVVLRHYVRTP